MGKKTTAFTQKLQKLSDESAEATQQLKDALEKLGKLDVLWKRLESQHDDRSLAIQKENGNVASKYEPIIDKDPELNRIGDDLSETGGELMAQRSARDKALKALRAVTNELDTETTQFASYIRAKESSKNPFKSKKSLPTAKELLKCAQQLLQKNQSLL